LKDDWKSEISPDDVEKFLAVHGRRGVKTLSLLSKSSKFYQAISSEIGQELLNEVMVKLELLLNKCIENKASNEEKADYRAYSNIFNEWAKRISFHQKLRKRVKG
jgi:hypothetical protein